MEEKPGSVEGAARESGKWDVLRKCQVWFAAVAGLCLIVVPYVLFVIYDGGAVYLNVYVVGLLCFPAQKVFEGNGWRPADAGEWFIFWAAVLNALIGFVVGTGVGYVWRAVQRGFQK